MRKPCSLRRFTLSLEVPPDVVALGNMPVESRTPSQLRHGYDLVSFQQTPPMPTYLLALAVGHLRGVSQTTGDFSGLLRLDFAGTLVVISGIMTARPLLDGRLVVEFQRLLVLAQVFN